MSEREEEQIREEALKELILKLRAQVAFKRRYAFVPIKMFKTLKEVKEVAAGSGNLFGIMQASRLGTMLFLYPTIVFAGNQKAITMGLQDLKMEAEKAGRRYEFLPEG